MPGEEEVEGGEYHLEEIQDSQEVATVVELEDEEEEFVFFQQKSLEKVIKTIQTSSQHALVYMKSMLVQYFSYNFFCLSFFLYLHNSQTNRLNSLVKNFEIFS